MAFITYKLKKMNIFKNCFLPVFMISALLISCEENKKSAAETIVVDNKVSAIPSNFGKVKFNNNFTGFKFADTTGSRYIFTKNGVEDARKKASVSGFSITPLENFGYKEAVEHLVELSTDYRNKENVMYVSEILRASEYVNKNAAQFHRFSVEENNNIRADVIQGIITKGKNSILFVGYGLEGDALKEKLLATFKSINF